MKALAKPKCFRRGHDFMEAWGSIINLIIQITTILFSNPQEAQIGALSARSKPVRKFGCADSRHGKKQNNQYSDEEK